MYDLEGVLGPRVIEFVERYVGTLLAWDILVFFHRNPDVELNHEELASSLGRRAEELAPEVDVLCRGQILDCSEWADSLRPDAGDGRAGH